MNCERVKDTLLLYLYNELEEREHEAFQEHLESCAGCAGVVEQERRLLGRLDQRPSASPSEALLAECRHDLMRSVYYERKDDSPRSRRLPAWSDLSRVFTSSPRTWQPAAALVLLVAGFYFGRASVGAPAGEASVSDIRSASLIPWETSVGEIQSVERDPDDGTVEIVLEATTRRTISGAPHAPHIRGPLISTVRTTRTRACVWRPSTHYATGSMTAKCAWRCGRPCSATPIRECASRPLWLCESITANPISERP